MEKNQEFTSKITSIGYNGEGICQIEDKTVFVPFALPDEIVKLKILKVYKKIAYAKVLEIVSASDSRVAPKCLVFGKCGGCQLQHLKYVEQLKIKSDIVKQCFSKIAGIDITVQNTVSCDIDYGYRNKLQLPVRRENDTFKIGFFAQNSHRIVEIESCPLHNSWADKIIACFKKYIFENKIYCYSEQDGKGSLRHIVVRELNNEFLIVAVTKDKLNCVDNLVKILKENFDNFSLIINVNKKDDNVIMGDNSFVAYGSGVIKDNLNQIVYDVVPESFVQVNDKVKNKLYDDIINLICQRKDLAVIDAYSGVGLISALVAKEGMETYPVEIVPQAVDSANKIVRENNLDTMHPICGDCSVIIPKIIDTISKNYQIYLDPTRKGVDKNALKAIKNSMPERIIYCSCSPQTLARDIGILLGTIDNSGKICKENLSKSAYVIESVTPYDMFPQTKHVETVAVLTKKE